ncbi:hypothetical protein [Arthrobacter sp. B3I4]|uniref:hypothetical protein n=1 Tax=Arthrobacter sp. B3I4 TaxID=3042267 RepID=UPI002781E692|nr:hypothetical protein [Arthrobacter sp. B3I4]MDQ0756277.1 hypothetical protein [Arthrobacter sp. B3I4]
MKTTRLRADESRHPRPRPPWTRLPRGLPVRITVGGTYVGQGTVDSTMPDGSALWILFNGFEGRRMFHRDDPVLIEVG